MNNPPSPNQPISSQQLIIETLNKLSNDLAKQTKQMLTQQHSEQQTHIDNQLAQITSELFKQLSEALWTRLSQQLTEQTNSHNQQISDYLNELNKLQKSEIATLKSGRDELESLQNKLQLG